MTRPGPDNGPLRRCLPRPFEGVLGVRPVGPSVAPHIGRSQRHGTPLCRRARRPRPSRRRALLRSPWGPLRASLAAETPSAGPRSDRSETSALEAARYAHDCVRQIGVKRAEAIDGQARRGSLEAGWLLDDRNAAGAGRAVGRTPPGRIGHRRGVGWAVRGLGRSAGRPSRRTHAVAAPRRSCRAGPPPVIYQPAPPRYRRPPVGSSRTSCAARVVFQTEPGMPPPVCTRRLRCTARPTVVHKTRPCIGSIRYDTSGQYGCNGDGVDKRAAGGAAGRSESKAVRIKREGRPGLEALARAAEGRGIRDAIQPRSPRATRCTFSAISFAAHRAYLRKPDTAAHQHVRQARGTVDSRGERPGSRGRDRRRARAGDRGAPGLVQRSVDDLAAPCDDHRRALQRSSSRRPMSPRVSGVRAS